MPAETAEPFPPFFCDNIFILSMTPNLSRIFGVMSVDPIINYYDFLFYSKVDIN